MVVFGCIIKINEVGLLPWIIISFIVERLKYFNFVGKHGWKRYSTTVLNDLMAKYNDSI